MSRCDFRPGADVPGVRKKGTKNSRKDIIKSVFVISCGFGEGVIHITISRVNAFLLWVTGTWFASKWRAIDLEV